MNGIESIAAERRRQIEAEGWTAEHDDEHSDGSLAAAAAAYTFSGYISANTRVYALDPLGFWPWDVSWWKPKTAREDLVRAGALIAAEIDRLDRADGRIEPAPGTETVTRAEAEAMVAAAYEAAAKIAWMHEWAPDPQVSPRSNVMCHAAAERIRALTPADATAALEAVKQAAREEEREACEAIAAEYWAEMHDGNQRGPISAAIRARGEKEGT